LSEITDDRISVLLVDNGVRHRDACTRRHRDFALAPVCHKHNDDSSIRRMHVCNVYPLKVIDLSIISTCI
jgi:hypothetical protein